MNGKIPSKAMRRHHHHARNQETGHAMKTRRSSQRMLYMMVDAMVVFTKSTYLVVVKAKINKTGTTMVLKMTFGCSCGEVMKIRSEYACFLAKIF